MKISSMVSLAALPLMTSGVLISARSAQAAGLLTPPPPDSNLTIQAVQAAGAGVTLYIRPVGGTPPAGTYSGFCPGPTPATECAYFDFQPPTGSVDPVGGFGTVFFSGTQPLGGSSVFQAIVGTTGRIKDTLLPFLGAPVNQPNLNLTIPGGGISAFVDANVADTTNVDTFDAKVLRSVIFQASGSGSTASFAFDGFWNIQEDPNDMSSVKPYAGSITFSQAFSETVNEVLNGTPTISGARQPNGYFAAPSIQANVTGVEIPEPSTLAGLAMVAGSAALLRKRKG